MGSCGLFLSFGTERRFVPLVAYDPQRLLGRRRGVERLGMGRAAVAVQEIVDPGARADQLAIGRGDERSEIGDTVHRLGALMHRDPDALLVDDLAAPEQ